MAFLADHGNRPILVYFTNAVNSGIGSHASPDDDVFMMFHGYSFFLTRARHMLKIIPHSYYDCIPAKFLWKNSLQSGSSNNCRSQSGMLGTPSVSSKGHWFHAS